MSDVYDEETLAAGSKLTSESEGLTENAEEWILGMISVPKSSASQHRPGDMPTYRRGWTFRVDDEMDFIVRPFTNHLAEASLAVLLRRANEEYFAGWFRASRREEVAHIVTQLNYELQAERERCRNEDTISVTVGSVFAPDAPWGAERVTVWSDGRIAYVRRESDGSTRRASGTVSVDVWQRVSTALARTSFPEQPDIDIHPGGGPPVIEATGGRRGRVVVDELESGRMEGYRTVVDTLYDFATGVRNEDSGVLAKLGFQPRPLAAASISEG